MQKWCPEPFEQPASPPQAAVADAAEFEATSAPIFGGRSPDVEARQFRRESGFTDSKSLMNSLTREERSQVYQLVELDLKEEYDAREADLKAQFDTRLAEITTEGQESLERWTHNLEDVLARDRHATAAAAARLAVQLAEKIVRRVVAADPEVLARAIETTIFKITETAPLTVRAHPADAEWLNGQSDLREKLNIAQIVADRRIESGGCLVQAGDREWDATLARQLETLTQVVDEMLAGDADGAEVPAAALPAAMEAEPATEDDNEPGLE